MTTRQPLRILAVGNTYPPHHTGGYELVWQAAMHHAASLGHQVRILTSEHREAHGLPEDDPDVHRNLRSYWRIDTYAFPEFNLRQRAALERHNAQELRRHLDEFRPDLVAWWSMGSLSLSMIERVRRAGFPASFVVHDDWLIYAWEQDQWIRIWRGRRRAAAPAARLIWGIPTQVSLKRAGNLIFNSRYTLERAREGGIDVTGAAVVHPGIDARFLRPSPAQPWGWKLAYVGRIDRQKGIDTLVRALSLLPAQASLAVWGSGDERYVAEMRGLAHELGIAERITFNGFADTEAVRGAYAEADAVVFPVRWEEPFGLVPLEAMGVGRPVVATARGGAAEYLKDAENALLFDPDDAEALAACLRRLADDGALRKRLVSGGRATATQYSAERFASETVRRMLSAVPGEG